MLEAIRTHAQGWLAKLILALITIPFALWGVDSYIRNAGDPDTIASVGDAKVSRKEFARTLQEEAERMREALGPNFDRAATETPEFRKKVLDSLLERKALLVAAEAQGFRVPASYIQNVLMQIPAFQENGQFSVARYEALLRQRGLTPVQFENELRQAYLLDVLLSPATHASFVARTAVEGIARLVTQARETSWFDLDPAAVSAKVAVSPADVEAYYAAHKAEFTEPERIRAEYVVLSIDALASQTPVGEEEIKAYYQANGARFAEPETRTASHILIAVPKNADAATRAKARARAEQLAEAVRKAPQSFADVARKESQDPGSAAQGGSLGSFGRGAMVKPFEDAVFSMKPGEIRGPVETDFGYHVIRLDAVQAAKTAPLDAVRAEIEAEIRKQKAQRKFSELAETFSNLVYEKADSLKPAADALKLDVRTTDWMSAATAPPPLRHPKLLQALFAADAIKSRQNTEAIEVAPGTLVAARVVDHRPAAVRPLKEVAGEIEARLRRERTRALLEQQGRALQDQLARGQETGTRWSDFKIVSRQKPEGFEPSALAAIFRVGTDKLPAYTGFLLPSGAYRIVRVTRVIEAPAPDPALMASIETGLARAVQRADMKAMIALIKAGQKVEIRPGALESK
jgi:peptidyl-prolyl cis-trans isomerase D